MSDPESRGGPLPAGGKGTGSRRVYHAIRDRILTLAYEPGMNLEEGALVDEFEVSRTPIREAFIRLASENLVTILPNRGARVADLSLNSVREFFEALSLTQRAVTRWAALRSSPERIIAIEQCMLAFEAAAAAADSRAMAATNLDFHVAVAACAGNSYLARTYRELLSEGMRLSQLAVVYDPPGAQSRTDHLAAISRDHREMLAAIKASDGDAGERLGRAHADLFLSRVADYIKGAGSVAAVRVDV